MICNIIHVYAFLGKQQADPQNCFDPGVGRYYIPLYLVKIPSWEGYYTF